MLKLIYIDKEIGAICIHLNYISKKAIKCLKKDKDFRIMGILNIKL